MPRVLVVEDDASIVTIVRYHLETAGFEGVFASDLDDGWRLLVSEAPDAAVIEIRLPGGESWSLLERMRADGRFSDLPVVILSALLDEETIRRARRYHCDYLEKPFAASTLLTKVRSLLAETEGAQEPGAREAPRAGRVTLVAVPVVLLVHGYEVRGTVHLPPELARFSDAWESLIRDQRAYLPVTDATVIEQGGREVATPAFLEVRKSEIRAVFPQDVLSERPFSPPPR